MTSCIDICIGQNPDQTKIGIGKTPVLNEFRNGLQ